MGTTNHSFFTLGSARRLLGAERPHFFMGLATYFKRIILVATIVRRIAIFLQTEKSIYWRRSNDIQWNKYVLTSLVQCDFSRNEYVIGYFNNMLRSCVLYRSEKTTLIGYVENVVDTIASFMHIYWLIEERMSFSLDWVAVIVFSSSFLA